MKPHPHPNVQIIALSGMGLDQSCYFRCRAKLHLEPFFAVTVFIVQTNKPFPFVNHPGNPQPSVLCSCIMLSAVTRTEQSRGGFAPPQKPEEKRTVQRGGKVRMRGKRAAGSHLLSEMKVISFTKLLSVIFWEQVHNFFHTRAQAVFITLHYLSLAGPFGLQPKKMRYSLALPAL